MVRVFDGVGVGKKKGGETFGCEGRFLEKILGKDRWKN